MSNRSRTGLIALALLLATGGLWWLLRGFAPGEAAGVRAVAGVAPAPADQKASRPALASLPEDALPEEAERAAAVDEGDAGGVDGVSAGRKGWWRVPQGSTWVRGRVELPEGTPLDEELWVTAEGSAFVEERDARRSHSARVEKDGSFSVAFSSRTKRKGKLTLRGKYLYLEEDHWVQLTEEEELAETVLEPRLGGRVVARVLPPRSVATTDEDVLEGVEVIATRGGFFSATEAEGWLLDEGEYELGGLEEGGTFTVVAKSPIWADGTTEDVEVEAGGTTIVDVPLSLGARLAGVVLDHEGAPVHGAKVMAMTAERADQRNPFLKVEPDEQTETQGGRFELRGVPPGEIVLIVEAEGFLEEQVELGELVDADERTTLNVRLDRGRLIAGSVQWPGNEPAEGAVVRLAQEDSFGNFELERVKGEIEVGADGRFEFSALGDEPCNVTASAIHPDDAPDPDSKLERMRAKRTPRWMARADEVAPGTLELTLTLSPGDVLSGKVVDDLGKPVDAFKVTANPAGDGMFSASSMRPVRGRFKDEKGAFHLEGVQDGEWEVSVSAAGYADSEKKTVTLPGAGELRFVVPRTGKVAGVVRTPKGGPGAGARVIVTHGGTKNAAVTAEDDGTFSVGKIEPGWVELVADAEGFGASEPQKLELAPAAEREGLVLALQPGAALTVVVHAEAGKISGRTLNLSGPTRGERTTDGEGRATFEGLDPGEYEVSLEPEGGVQFGGDQDDWLMRFANQKSVDVTVEAGEQLEVVVGGPSATAVTVRGRITRHGEPVAGALVMTFPAKGGSGRPEGAVRADDEGRYQLRVDGPGEWRFQVGGDFGDRVTFDEELPEGQKEVTLDFEIPEARIEGVVTGPGGELVEELRLSLVAAESDGADAQTGWFGQRFAATDEKGHFSFENLAPGRYNLRAGGSDSFGFTERGADYGRVIVEVEVEDENHVARADVKLETAGKITGYVHAADGSPLARAHVRVMDGDGRRLSHWDNVRTAADGSFTYDGVSPGTYLVGASGEVEGEPAEAESREVRVYEGGVAEVFLIAE